VAHLHGHSPLPLVWTFSRFRHLKICKTGDVSTDADLQFTRICVNSRGQSVFIQGTLNSSALVSCRVVGGNMKFNLYITDKSTSLYLSLLTKTTISSLTTFSSPTLLSSNLPLECFALIYKMEFLSIVVIKKKCAEKLYSFCHLLLRWWIFYYCPPM